MATATVYANCNSNIDAINSTTIGGGVTFWPTGRPISNSQRQRGLLWFDLSHFGRDWTINSAQLKISVNTSFVTDTHTLNIYRCRRRWYQGSVAAISAPPGPSPQVTYAGRASWDNYVQSASPLAWGTAGCADTTNDREDTTIGSTSVTSSTSGIQTITLDTAKVQEWINGDFRNDGLVLIASIENAATLMRWNSIDNGTAANRPQLVIDYTATTPELTDGLECVLRMEENGGTLSDSSDGNHDFAPTNTPTRTTGKLGFGQAYVKASTQYHSNADAELLQNEDWTAAVWVNLTNKTDLYTVMSACNDAQTLGWRLFYHRVDLIDAYVIQLYGDGEAAGGDECIADGHNPISPTAGTFQLVVVRHDATRNFLHLALNDTTPTLIGANHSGGADNGSYGTYYVGTAQPAATSFRLGAEPGGTQQPLSGALDQFMYWTRCLSDNEILDLYNGGSGMDPLSSGGGSRQRGRFGLALLGRMHL